MDFPSRTVNLLLLLCDADNIHRYIGITIMLLYNVRAGTRATKKKKEILSAPTHTRESCRADPPPSCSQYNNNNMYIMWCVVLGDGATRRNQSRPITAKLFRSGHPRGLTGISSRIKYLGGGDSGVPPEFYAYIAPVLLEILWNSLGIFTHPIAVVSPCYTLCLANLCAFCTFAPPMPPQN